MGDNEYLIHCRREIINAMTQGDAELPIETAELMVDSLISAVKETNP